ncbi:30S ribosome-binding factor RbfA [Buchnera aphidicola]|uniref:30S ribosome-binding factor RbfA n=1 Tax=Buchnera aphidicola TaxID=9 RepID=UPI0031B8436B
MKYLKKNNASQYNRIMRIEQFFKKEIANILYNNLNDPRINFMITISEVKILKDLSCAKVFITYFNVSKSKNNCVTNMKSIKNILKILKKASGYIRSVLCHKINIRKIPYLKFYYDNSIIEGIKIDNLLNKIN